MRHRLTNIVSKELANFRGSSVRHRNDLDQRSLSDCLPLITCEESINVDIPFSRKPSQRLQGDYRARPYKCPFRPIYVCVVSLFG